MEIHINVGGGTGSESCVTGKSEWLINAQLKYVVN